MIDHITNLVRSVIGRWNSYPMSITAEMRSFLEVVEPSPSRPFIEDHYPALLERALGQKLVSESLGSWQDDGWIALTRKGRLALRHSRIIGP